LDTGTHFVMGIALGGLASIDPVVYNHPETYQSVLIATIVGSQIPDIDTVLKLRNNAVYIRNHRGITHSIPAVVLWPLFIVLIMYLFNPEINKLHLWLWTFLAVFLHVFVDIFNAYGTQALRPFSSKWVALGLINTFDPFIFGIHALGIGFWLFGGELRVIFPTMYIVLIGYYLYRYSIKKTLVSIIKRRIPNTEQIIISPTIKFFHWRVAVITKNRFFVAYAYQNSFTIVDEFERIPFPDTPVMNRAIKDTNVAAFLSFSPVYRWEIEEGSHYIEVRFIDLRYRSKEHYPFFAVVKMDHNMNILTSYTGWIYSKDKIRKKLEILPQ